MDGEVANVVEAILTAILQWRVTWLDEQKLNNLPPPICRSTAKKLKITYENYKDYESTFVPLLMHEIWAQIFDSWTKLEYEMTGVAPMDVDVDDQEPRTSSNSSIGVNSILSSNSMSNSGGLKRVNQSGQRHFPIGLSEHKFKNPYQNYLKCQHVIESKRVNSHLKLIGEGDLVRLDLDTVLEQLRPNQSDYRVNTEKNSAMISLFAYVEDVTSERITQYTELAPCYASQLGRIKHGFHVINYNCVIAKRPLRLRPNELMKMSGLYYLKPMIRQIESVAMLKESCLANDILSPKLITCQLTVPTVIAIKSPHYNEMQYKAIIGANEALNRNIPKIQLIQGPPGTGKTHTLIGMIKHFYMNLRDTVQVPKILICAPSNGAIDEVSKRLYKEREFSKKGSMKRSLRMVRVGHPDQISQVVKHMSLEELVEVNAKNKVESLKKKNTQLLQELEKELADCDTEIANLRYSNKSNEIPKVEAKIARLIKEVEHKKNSEESHTRREASDASKRSIRYDLVRNADVILTTLNSCQRHPLDAMFRSDRSDLTFHCVIVDEASQCCEPELLMPLCYKISRMILIGDPMQLPATVISRYAQEFDFGRSLFERLFIHFGKYDPTSPIAMLTEQYRMHPEICEFPSKQFYDGRLISAPRRSGPYPLKPYIMFDLRHGSQKSNMTSFENEVEAGLVINLLVAVLTKAPEHSQVGVITPYKGQKKLITSKIASLQTQRNIKVDVNTCDGFQGQEKDIIILSCVRTFESKSSVGFLKSYQRVNVALTRAKHCLIICISGKKLTNDKTWQALITNASDRNCIQTLTHTPDSPSLGAMIAASNFTSTGFSIPNNRDINYSSKVNSIVRDSNTLQPMSDVEPPYAMPMDID